MAALINDAVVAERYLTVEDLRRAGGDVGKRMGSAVYVHRDYEGRVVPEDLLAKARAVLQREHPEMAERYNAVKYDRKKRSVTFQHSPDFDEADEPTVGDSVRVRGNGAKFTRRREDPQIWHHKWMWVDDDYPGFDVEAAKQRSATWRSHIKPGESSRIGRRSYWDSIRPRWESPAGQVTESVWYTLTPTGNFKKDLLSFYELEYKYSRVAQGAVKMTPLRREKILERMKDQALDLGMSIAQAVLPTYDVWIRAHDLEHTDIFGDERMRKLQRLYKRKSKTSNIHDWVLKQSTVYRSMSRVEPEEWLEALQSSDASMLRFALELLHEAERPDISFDRFITDVVAHDPIGSMRRAITRVDGDEQEAVVLQMFQTVYPIGYKKRLSKTSAEVMPDIVKSRGIFQQIANREIPIPQLFASFGWAINVVHQFGAKMYGHVAADLGVSASYFDKLSNLDTTTWDEELQQMATGGVQRSSTRPPIEPTERKPRNESVVERYDLTPDEVAATNRTCRTNQSGNTWGDASKVHEYLRDNFSPDDGVVLDFGAGNPPTHGQKLRDEGWDVEFHEHGDNFDPEVHAENALSNEYDIVIASKVLNVQPNPEALDATAQQMADTVKQDGVLVANYPEPHKCEQDGKPLTIDEVKEILGRHFTSVERAKGTSSSPILVARHSEVEEPVIVRDAAAAESYIAEAQEYADENDVYNELMRWRGWLMPDGKFVKLPDPSGDPKSTHAWFAYRFITGKEPGQFAQYLDLVPYEIEMLNRGAVRMISGAGINVSENHKEMVRKALDFVLEKVPDVERVKPGLFTISIDIEDEDGGTMDTHELEVDELRTFDPQRAVPQSRDPFLQSLWRRRTEAANKKNPPPEVMERAQQMLQDVRVGGFNRVEEIGDWRLELHMLAGDDNDSWKALVDDYEDVLSFDDKIVGDPANGGFVSIALASEFSAGAIDGDDDWDTGPINWDKAYSSWSKAHPLKKLPPRPPFYATWEIPGQLARSSRPGYPSKKQIPQTEVDRWIDGAKKEGIKSIILLLGNDQLPYYDQLPGGLPGYYRANGFDVAHIPMIDMFHVYKKMKGGIPKNAKHVSDADLAKAYEAYKELPKPVLVHCSAGIDRSGAVVRYIKSKEIGPEPPPKPLVVDAELQTSATRALRYLAEAGFGSYVYIVPEDKEQRLYDFYMLSYLPSPEILRDKSLDLAASVAETREILIPKLKSAMLNAAFYSIACEARYIIERTAGGKKAPVLKQMASSGLFTPSEIKKVEEYWDRYWKLHKGSSARSLGLSVKGEKRRYMDLENHEDRDNSYRAAIHTFKDDPQTYVKFASWGFHNRPWHSGFGGYNWGRIADNWLNLFNAHRIAAQNKRDPLLVDTIYIDVLYSLQHNTGKMLNKVKSYAKNGRYTWIDRALDKKFGADSPYEMFDDISSQMRTLAAAAIKAGYGTTLEKWQKDNPDGTKAKNYAAIKNGHHSPYTSVTTSSPNKDYVHTTTYALREDMRKSLLEWYAGVTEDNVDALLDAAESTYSLADMKKWQWPAHSYSPTTSMNFTPPLTQASNDDLVVLSGGAIGTTTKHKYFSDKKPGFYWMSAKNIGLKHEKMFSKKNQPAPTVQPFKPKPPKPKPKPKPVDTITADTINPALADILKTPYDDVYVQVWQPPDAVQATKGVHHTFDIGLADSKTVVTSAKNQTPDYLMMFWPVGNFLHLDGTTTQHPTAEWVEAVVAQPVKSVAGWTVVPKTQKMLKLGSLYYLQANTIMSDEDIEKQVASAPMPGQAMAQVVKLGHEQPGKMIDSLTTAFGAPKSDAEEAVEKLGPAEVLNLTWVNYHAGTPIFTLTAFTKQPGQEKVKVAIWHPETKSVVPVELSAWREAEASFAGDTFYVIDSAFDAAKAIVAAKPASEVLPAWEKKSVPSPELSELGVYFKVFVDIPGKGVTDVFDDYAVSWQQVQKMVAMLKDPKSNTIGGPYSDNQIEIYKYAAPGVWPKGYGPSTDEHTKVELLDTSGNVKWTDAKWHQAAEQKPSKVVKIGPTPHTREQAAAFVAGDVKIPREPIDEPVVYFEVKIIPPGHTDPVNIFGGNGYAEHWGQVEQMVDMLTHPENHEVKIVGAPYDNDKIYIKKFANPIAFPAGHEYEGQHDASGPVPVESLTVDGVVDWVDDSWKKTVDAQHASSKVGTNDWQTGAWPTTYALALKWAKYAKMHASKKGATTAGASKPNHWQYEPPEGSVIYHVVANVGTTGFGSMLHTFDYDEALTAAQEQCTELLKQKIKVDPSQPPVCSITVRAKPEAWPESLAKKYSKSQMTVEKIDVKGQNLQWMNKDWENLQTGGEVAEPEAPEPEAPTEPTGSKYTIKDPAAGDFSIRIYKGGYADEEDVNKANELMVDGVETYDSYEAAMNALQDWLDDVHQQGDTEATGEVMHLATSETWDGPEEYVEWWDDNGQKSSNTPEWQAALQAWGDAGGHAQGEKPAAEPAKAEFPDDFKHDTGQEFIDQYGEDLTKQSEMDLEDHAGETFDEFWDDLSGETQADILKAIEASTKGPELHQKMWNAWTVQEAMQLDLLPDVKKELKAFGGGQVLGEIWSDLSEDAKTDIGAVIATYAASGGTQGLADTVADWPRPDEYEGDVHDLPVMVVLRHLAISDQSRKDIIEQLAAHGKEPDETTTMFDLWSYVMGGTLGDVEQAYQSYMESHQSAGPTIVDTTPPAKKKKKAKPTGKAAAEKAVKTWKLKDVKSFLELTNLAAMEIDEEIDSEGGTAKLDDVWDKLTAVAQMDIVDAYIAKKAAKKKAPKKKKKTKAPTSAEAEKNIKTWKLGSVKQFLLASADDKDELNKWMKDDGFKDTDTLGAMWNNVGPAWKSFIIKKYVDYMKKKHGLEAVAARAVTYLAEAKKEKGPVYPRITRQVFHGAEGGRDLYFVKFKADGREYCYALGDSLRSYISKAKSISMRKAASIVKAKSAGEYDCDTGDLKTPKPSPREEPPEVQTTLFDEAAAAADYLGETANWRTLRATGDLATDLERFAELEYKLGKVRVAGHGPAAAQMERQLRGLTVKIAETVLPTFEDWIVGHDTANVEGMADSRFNQYLRSYENSRQARLTGMGMAEWIIGQRNFRRTMTHYFDRMFHWHYTDPNEAAAELKRRFPEVADVMEQYFDEWVYDDDMTPDQDEGSPDTAMDFDDYVERLIDQYEFVDHLTEALENEYHTQHIPDAAAPRANEAIVRELMANAFVPAYEKMRATTLGPAQQRITKARDDLERVMRGRMPPAEAASMLTMAINAAHQTATMRPYIARDHGLSVEEMDRLSNMDTSGWDQELADEGLDPHTDPETFKQGALKDLWQRKAMGEDVEQRLSANDKKVLDRLESDEFPAKAEAGKAFVFHWADGRGACAFRFKKDAIAWITDANNHGGDGPDIVGFWYDAPYCPKSKRDKKHRLRVATRYKKATKMFDINDHTGTNLGESIPKMYRSSRKYGTRPQDAELVDLIDEMLASGMTQAEVARDLGMRPKSIYSYVKRYGMDVPSKGGPRNKELVGRIRDLLASGKTRAEVARELGLGTNQVSQYVNIHGLDVTATGRRKVLGPEFVDYVRDELANGKSQSMIARDLGVSPPVVSLFARKHGLGGLSMGRHRYDQDDLEIIRLSLASGMSSNEVAADLGIPRSTVHYLIQKHGLSGVEDAS